MSEWSEVQRLGAGVRRFWWVVSMCTVLAAALGFFVTKSMTAVYEAKTSVLVGQLGGVDVDNSAVRARQGLAAVYADLVRREPVLAPVAAKVGVKGGWKTLSQRLVVSVPHEDTQLIAMTVEGPSPAEATRTAKAITDELISLTAVERSPSGSSPSFAAGQLGLLERNIQDAQLELRQLNEKAPSAAAARATRDRIDLLNQQIIDWQRVYIAMKDAALAPSGNGTVTVLDQPKASSTPVRPNMRFNVIIAGCVGLVIGLVGVYVAAGRFAQPRYRDPWESPGRAAPYMAPPDPNGTSAYRPAPTRGSRT